MNRMLFTFHEMIELHDEMKSVHVLSNKVTSLKKFNDTSHYVI